MDLLGIVNGLWDALQNKADEQINRYRQESDSKTVLMQHQLTEARQLETNLRQNIHTLEEQLHQLKEETRQLTAKLMTETQDKIRHSERASVLEARRQEHTEENQRLHQLLKHVQENLEHYQSATQKLREEQSLLMEKQRNEYDQRLSQLLAQTQTVISEKSALQAQYDQLTKTHDLIATEHKTLANQFLELQHQKELIKIKSEKNQHDYDKISDHHQTQTAELLALKQVVVELQLNIKNEKISSLEESLAKTNDKIEKLRHDGQFILQEKASLEGQLKQMNTLISSNKIAALA